LYFVITSASTKKTSERSSFFSFLLFLDHHHRHPFSKPQWKTKKMAILISLHLPQPINPTLLPFWKENRNMFFLLTPNRRRRKNFGEIRCATHRRKWEPPTRKSIAPVG
jgi:hypothetical protein